LATAIITICVVGVYSAELSTFDVMLTIGLGFVGYLLRRYEFDLAPLILAFVLGPIFERSLRQMLIVSDGKLLDAILHSWIAAVFVGLGIFILAAALLRTRRRPAALGAGA